MALSGGHVAGAGDHVGDHNLADAQLTSLANGLSAAVKTVNGTAPNAAGNVNVTVAATSDPVAPACITWDGTGAQPLRSTVTADSARKVFWFTPAFPTVGVGAFAAGVDVWFRIV